MPFPSLPSSLPQVVSVHVWNGEGLADKDVFTKSDPYVAVGFDTQVPPFPNRSRTCNNTTEPEWDDEVPDIVIPPSATSLILEVYDEVVPLSQCVALRCP